MVVNLAVAEIKVQFEVGYQFKLTIVARVQPRDVVRPSATQ